MKKLLLVGLIVLSLSVSVFASTGSIMESRGCHGSYMDHVIGAVVPCN